MPEQTPEVTSRMTENMRDTLLENGFYAAKTQPPENIHRKIKEWWPGGIAGYIKDHS